MQIDYMWKSKFEFKLSFRVGQYFQSQRNPPKKKCGIQ